MNQRQKELQQLYLNNEKKVLNELKSNYAEAINDIKNKLAILESREDADLPNVIHQVKYQKMLLKQNEEALAKLQKDNYDTISEYLNKSYEDGFIGTMYDIQGQDVPLVVPIDQKQVVKAIQHETKLSDDLYKVLGKDTKVLSKNIASEITRSISNAATFAEIGRNISSACKISQNNSMRIARTEGHRIQCQATMDACNKAKERGADVVKQWDASLDNKTRDTHRRLDGQIRELDEPFEVDGMTAMQPGGFNDPSEDCNCRCALLQRARWALGNEYTKWSSNEPEKITDFDVNQLVEIKAKDFTEFKGYYQDIAGQMTANMTIDFNKMLEKAKTMLK